MRKRKVGVALGAGSTKGFAHIGVLQALEENHIPIDCITGSSIGAIVGGIYSVGSDMRMLAKLAVAINLRDYFDLRNPATGGLLRGDRMQEIIKLLTHGKTFDKTKTPFACVAVDLSSGELVCLKSGLLHESIRASMSIPGIFTPMSLDGRTFVDGGVIERVPCRAAKDLGADVIIGVDVGYRGGFDSESVGINAYSQFNRCVDIMQWEITKLRMGLADITLAPNVRALTRGHFDTSEAEQCIEQGRRAVVEALPEIRKILKKNRIAFTE